MDTQKPCCSNETEYLFSPGGGWRFLKLILVSGFYPWGKFASVSLTVAVQLLQIYCMLLFATSVVCSRRGG
jgi:hypothetical protein